MMVEDASTGAKIWNNSLYIFLGLLAASCILPVIHVLAVSFSSKAASAANLVRFTPVGFHTRAYQKVLTSPLFIRSFGISVLRVLVGTAVNMFMVSITSYPLSKEPGEFKGRLFFVWLIFFPMLFTGGLIPTYLQVRNLGLIDSFWSLILPTAVPMFSIIIMMNFFRGIPKSLSEAAYIEGAGHLTVLRSVYLPISTAAIATLTLFAVVGHWNEWFQGFIYINDTERWPLQTYLRQMLLPTTLQNLTLEDLDTMQYLSDKNFKAAQIFIAMIPILLFYPFLQRYFIAGLTLGSVKE